MKICYVCRTEKPINEFYRHIGSADGRLNKCKECTRAYQRELRLKKADYYREYDRLRGNRQGLCYTQNWRSQNPEKYKAQNAVNNAVRDKRLTKPKNCEQCGSSDRIHGHHDDYSKPLNVLWLCAACHKARHKQLGWGYIWNDGMDRAG